MNDINCSLWILVARTDLPFMMHTIPHLVRMSRCNFSERVLALDTAPLSGDKVGRPGIGTLEQLRACCQQLVDEGIVDKVVDINYSSAYQNHVYLKHFGSPIQKTHNYKGYPILGTIFHIESAKSDYMLHYDSDMLLYQHPDYSWIEEGIKLLQQNPDVIAVRPLTGPPTPDGSIYQKVPYQKDAKGFYKFKFFGSRVYLIDRRRFDQFLPLPIIWRSYRNRIFNLLPNNIKTVLNNATGKNNLDSWEIMVSQKLEKTPYVRAVLDSPLGWTIHPPDRSPQFLNSLPDLIQKIESGWYPLEQAGHYDLKIKYWF